MQRKLEVNRDLIDADFETYRLNLAYRHERHSETFPAGQRLHSFRLANADYSYCHASMASTINGLRYDRFRPKRVYFVTDAGNIFAASPQNCGKFKLINVYTITDFDDANQYASLSFPSPTIALISISTRRLAQKFVVRANDHEECMQHADYDVKFLIAKRTFTSDDHEDADESWTIEDIVHISRRQLYSNLDFITSSHIHLFDSSTSISGGITDESRLNLIIGSVNECFAQIDGQVKSRFCAILHRIELRKVVSIAKNRASWHSIGGVRRFVEDARPSNDFPKFIALADERDLMIVNERRMKFSFDAPDQPNIFFIDERNENQTVTLTLSFTSPDSPKIDVEFREKYLKICVNPSDANDGDNNAIVLEGEINRSIDVSKCDYCLIDDHHDKDNCGSKSFLLIVRLEKQRTDDADSGCDLFRTETLILHNCKIDQFAAESEPIPIKVRKEESISEIEIIETMHDNAREAASKTTNIFDEYEDFDMQDDVESSASLIFTRFDAQTGLVLDEYDLSTQKWLFAMPYHHPNNHHHSTSNSNSPISTAKTKFPFVFVFRHDVDAFVYEIARRDSSLPPHSSSSSSDSIEFRHCATFPAFGYVQASKQNRRFSTFCQEVNEEEEEEEGKSTDSSCTASKWRYSIIDNWHDSLLYVYCPFGDRSNCGQQFLFHFADRPAMIFGLYAVPKFLPKSLNNNVAKNCDQNVVTEIGENRPKCNASNAVFVLSENAIHLLSF